MLNSDGDYYYKADVRHIIFTQVSVPALPVLLNTLSSKLTPQVSVGWGFFFLDLSMQY